MISYLKKLFSDNSDQKKQMITMAMIHKLRTPLTEARWAVEEVLKTVDSEHKNMLEKSKDKIIESIKLTSEIMDTAKLDISDGDFKTGIEKINFNSFVAKILSNLNFLAKNKKITLNTTESERMEIKGNPKLLDLAITNIFDNAMRYSPEGGVNISLSKINNKACLTVSDTGIGIDPADMGHLFQKFFRGKNAILLDPNESGFGLYATKKIIEMHGGSINISSVLGKGTKVEVILPIY